jgi:HD-like signal output (HDOD) protein
LPVERDLRDVTVLSALLHDIGRFVLASKMPAEFVATESLAGKQGNDLVEAELKLLGTSHAEVGAYLLGLWGIPDLAVEAIAHHHHPARIPHAGFDSSVALYAADLLACELEAPPSDVTRAKLSDRDLANLDSLGLLPRWAEFRELAQNALKCKAAAVTV